MDKVANVVLSTDLKCLHPSFPSIDRIVELQWGSVSMLMKYLFIFSFVETHVLSRIDGEPYQHPRWVLCLRLDFQGPLTNHEQGLKVFKRVDGCDNKLGQYRPESVSELCIQTIIFGMMAGARERNRPEQCRASVVEHL
jgi:hypothetical protein